MLRDSKSYETQLIDAVRSVNRALGGTYGTSSAIYKNEYNQFEVQLIDAIKGIGRTLSGNGISIKGGLGGGEVSAAEFQDLSRRVSKLESESFFRLVDGNITLKEQYSNLWVPGWLAAGGIGSGGGGGGATFLSQLEDVSIDTTTLADGHILTWDASAGESGMWVNKPNSGGGNVQVTNYGSTSSGKIATITVGSNPGVDIYNGVYWGRQYSDNTVDVTINGTTKNICLDGYAGSVTGYIGTTQVQSSAAAQDLTGILSIKALSASASKIEWEPNAGGTGIGAWHFYGNMYADGWIAAGGVGSGGGGGSSTLAGLSDVSLSSPSNGQALIYRNGVWQNETIPGGGGSTVNWGSSGSDYVYLSVNGTSKKLLTAHQDLSGYVTLATTQTITGAKTFTAPVTVDPSGNASSYIDIGNARLVYDAGANALHITKKSGSATVGLFADGFVAAGGVAGQTTASYVDLESAQTIGGNKLFTGTTSFNSDRYTLSINNDEINFESRLYIQYNSEDLCLTRSGKTIIGPYPGSTAIGSNKLYVGGSACFAGIIDTGYSSGHVVSIQDIVNRIVALENA